MRTCFGGMGGLAPAPGCGQRAAGDYNNESGKEGTIIHTVNSIHISTEKKPQLYKVPKVRPQPGSPRDSTSKFQGSNHDISAQKRLSHRAYTVVLRGTNVKVVTVHII